MFDRHPSDNSNTPQPELSTPIKTRHESSDSSFSPSISRYGRSHKLKMQDDYVSTDKKVSAYLKLSPGNQMQYFSAQKELKKKTSPKKLDTKEHVEGTPRRGRPPKIPIKDKIKNEDALKAALQIEPQDPTSPIDGCEWMVGDLAWARVGGHPFWPCIIALDPTQKIFTKTVRKGRTVVNQRMVHVQFFGDNGRRSWLNTTAIMSYNGRDAFIQLGDTILAGMRKKEPKQTSAFVIKPAVVQVWEKAVQEAEDLINASREERIAFFTTHFPPAPVPYLTKSELIEIVLEQPESPPKKRGRKRKAEESPLEEESKKKQMKLDEVKAEIEPVKPSSKVESPILSTTPRTIADRKKRQALLMQLARSNQSTPAVSSTPVTPDSSNTADTPKMEVENTSHASTALSKQAPMKRTGAVETTTDSIEKKKPKKKYEKKKISSDFQAFCSRRYERVADDHPELNEKEINVFMQDLWNKMSETKKARYRVKDLGNDKEENGSVEETTEFAEECLADIEEEVRSSKSSSPGPLATPTQKSVASKRNNCKYLFSGAKAEKVCQICERAGDTVRCRGPCQGYYHPDCITNPPVAEVIATPAVKKGKRGRPKKSLGQSPSSSDTSHSEEQIIPNTMVDTKEDVLKVVEESEVKGSVEHNGFDKKKEDVPSVEVIEPDLKVLTKVVRKGSKDSDSGEESEGFRCKDCTEGRSQPCFVCHEYIHKKSNEAKLYRCITAYCGKVYHEECLKPWPQSSWRSNGNGKSCDRGVMTCPQHTCHTCASDNPGVIKARYSNDKLVRCVRCPATYHYGNYCLPAGSEILTNSQIICPQHYQAPKKGLIHHVNAAWCFICASGGSLICCDLCPTAFHADCLKISLPPDGSYVCEDCNTGRFPLYGEIVWVKLGTYRWWPAEILYPALIPDNILNLPHVRGEFAVKFFGSHDHYWVNRGRVFLYQDGDTAGKGSYKKSSVDHMFERAVREASEAQRKYLEEKATREAETRPGMKPPNYVKLKANRPVGNVRTMEMNLSNLTPCECDPSSEAPCAPESDCLNRILMVECNPLVCPAGDKCCNQLFEKRQYPPLQPYQTQARGWGLKTLVTLKKGDFVIEYVGEMIDEEEYKKRLSHMHENNEENFYFLTIDKDRMLDAGPKGNVARFMNHSCQPNCETQKWTVNGDTRVGLFALCDIPANTELVFNYNLESIGSDKKRCMCGAPNCSGFIGVKAIKNQEKEEIKEKRVVKKKKTVLMSKNHEDDCFVCRKSGELLLCDGKHCTKGYHLTCLGKKQRPQGYWLCPWHQCNICNKGRVRRCMFCVNSYCQEHSEGNIRLDAIRGLVCSNHDQVSDANAGSIQCNDISGIDNLPSSESSSMEVDGESSEDSTTGSNQGNFDPLAKEELINNNIIKPVNMPEQRSRRSQSYSGGKPSLDSLIVGDVQKITKRRSRPSSVDDKLITSYVKTEFKKELSPTREELDHKVLVHNDVNALLNQVINNLPIKEIVPEIEVKLDQEHVDRSALEIPPCLEENTSDNQSLKMDNCTKEQDNINEDMKEAENKEDTQHCKNRDPQDIGNSTKVLENDTSLPIDSVNLSDSTELVSYNESCINFDQVEEPKTENNKVHKNDLEKSLEMNENNEIVDEHESQEFSTIISKCSGNSQDDTTNIVHNMNEIENKADDFKESFSKHNDLQVSTEVKVSQGENESALEDTTSEKLNNLMEMFSTEDVEKNESTAESCIINSDDLIEEIIKEKDNSKVLPVEEHDDFELSYSDCSNDRQYKSVTNAESSIEMKLTGCTSNDDGRITNTIEDINNKNELSNCIEQSNPMEVV